MKLSECTYGTIVIGKVISSINEKIGMVVGLAENLSKEPIPLVKWSDGEEQAIHHTNLNLYKD